MEVAGDRTLASSSWSPAPALAALGEQRSNWAQNRAQLGDFRGKGRYLVQREGEQGLFNSFFLEQWIQVHES